MDNDQKFWATLWTLLAATVVSISFSITSYALYESYAVKAMVLNGSDPLEVRCAYEVYDRAICAIVASRK